MIPIGFIGVSMITAGAVGRFGSEEHKHELLGGIVRGRPEAIAMSEPEAGSDVGNLSCRAERSDGDYVVNGQKTWITGAHASDHVLLVCRTDPNRGQAPRHIDDLGPGTHRGNGGPRDRDDGRP